MRSLVVTSMLMAALGASRIAQAQSAAAFPDVGSRAQHTESTPSVSAQPAAPAPSPTWTPISTPAAPAATRFGTYAARSWSPPPRSYSLGGPPGEDAVPPGYVREKRPRTLLLALGGVTLGLPWATGLGIAAGSGFANGSGWLAAPVIGPWAALGKRSNPCDGVDKAKSFNSQVGQCVAEPLARAMLVFDGVLQATGAVLLAFGAHPDTVLVRKTAPGVTVAVAPSPVGDRGYGVNMIGLF